MVRISDSIKIEVRNFNPDDFSCDFNCDMCDNQCEEDKSIFGWDEMWK